MDEQVATDEMPAMPSISPTDETIDTAAVNMDDLQGVPDKGQVIPLGTYHFRLDRHFEQNQPPRDDADQGVKDLGDQPGFGLLWICQEEPHTGESFMDNMSWVNSLTVKLAREGSAAARKTMKRLSSGKSLMAACAFKPSGGYNIVTDFLANTPECRIRVGKKKKKTKDDDSGKYVETGEWVNFAIQYHPLVRPA